MTNKRNSYAFWLGFLIAIVIVVAVSIYFYQGNKDKKLKDIKSQLEKLFKTKLPPKPISVTRPKKIVPKKFISKR